MAEEGKVQNAPDNTGNAGADESILNPTPEGTEGAAKPEGDGKGNPAPEAGSDDDGNGLLNPEAGKGDAGKGEEGKKTAPEGAPEKYADFKLPEGFQLNDEGKSSLSTLFKGLNLSQKAGQKLVDAYVEQQTKEKEAQLLALTEQRKQWRAQIKARPTYASDRAFAMKGLNAVVSTPEERKLFTNTWMSDHPVLFDIFVKVGKMVGEDSPLPAGGAAPSTGDNASKRFPVKIK